MTHRIRTSLFAALSAATLLVATQAAAHAKLVSSNPAANATVAAPKAITLTFSEKLTPAFSKLELDMVDHGMKVPVKTTVSKDGKSLTGTPQGALMKGAYTVKWQAASADGHKMSGVVNFRVG